MTIDCIVLHGQPGEAADFVRFHAVQAYDGNPHLSVAIRMTRVHWPDVQVVDVHYVLTHLDAHGIPHYRMLTEPNLSTA